MVIGLGLGQGKRKESTVKNGAHSPVKRGKIVESK
jgi:hypothetical protein